MNRRLVTLVGIAALVAVLLLGLAEWPTPRATTPMIQSVYVWQRAWTDAVKKAVSSRVPAMDGGAVVLAAEVAFDAAGRREIEVALDHERLARSSVPVGLALRIGPCTRAQMGDPATVQALAALAGKVVDDARSHGWTPSELQIDFDCATARLDAYRAWIAAIGAAVRPVPLTITVLPSWMSSGAFGPLVRSCAGFVLQVHSVEKSALEGDAPTLCDTASAVRWTERASRFGVPFVVALPTYGYIAVLDEKGALRSLIAEQGGDAPAPGGRVREVGSDPAALAQLVERWMRSRPQAMRGIVWYRLPVDGDRLNWSWPTLARVRRGEAPRGSIAVEVVDAGPRLFDVVARNDGDADVPLPASVRVEWGGAARLLGADALAGVACARSPANHAGFVRTAVGQASRLRPGERRTLGWVRLDTHTEVTVHVDATE